MLGSGVTMFTTRWLYPRQTVLRVMVFTLFASSLAVISAAEMPAGIKLEAHQFDGFGAYNAVAEIAAYAHVVIGFEAVRPKEWSAYDFHFSGGTLADLLDSFVNQNPDYQWEVIEDGVFRVRRRGEPVSLAAEAVSYPGAVNATRKEIWEGIQGLPEVKAWMLSNHCSPLDLLSGNEFRIHNKPIGIEPQSLSVSQLLDKVALRSGSNSWTIIQSPPGALCTITLKAW